MTNFINQNSAIFRASLALNPQRGPGVAPRGAAQCARPCLQADRRPKFSSRPVPSRFSSAVWGSPTPPRHPLTCGFEIFFDSKIRLKNSYPFFSTFLDFWSQKPPKTEAKSTPKSNFWSLFYDAFFECFFGCVFDAYFECFFGCVFH